MADAPAPHHALVMQFVAALLQRTLGCPTVEAHQHALQGFLDDLTPWISPAELPTLVQQPFTLFDHLAFTPRGDDERTSRWPCLREGRSCSAPGCASGGWTRWCAAREERIMPESPPQDHARARLRSPRLTPRSPRAKLSANETRTRYRRLGSSSSPCPPPSWPGSICRRPCTRRWSRRSGCARTGRGHGRCSISARSCGSSSPPCSAASAQRW